MTWTFHPHLSLHNERIPDADADRQTRTAVEILRRFEGQSGVVLADEVGMGKTFVALAVAASVLLATGRRKPVVVMVPAGVAEKWVREWEVFSQACLPKGHGLRASEAIRRGGAFMKLLDDDAERRKHIIFLTHGALNQSLADPFIRLALIRRALLRRSQLEPVRRSIERFAGELLAYPRFDEKVTADLLGSPISQWRSIWSKHYPEQALDDDPVPFAVDNAIGGVDLGNLREALTQLPRQRNETFKERLRIARRALRNALDGVWKAGLARLNVRLPLLILDEAHHAKNDNRLASLFANHEAEDDAELLQGPLGNMFRNMLFLTATPFQLGHGELLRVLDRFHGVRWPSVYARKVFDDQLNNLKDALDRAQGAALRLELAWGRIDVADADIVGQLDDLADDAKLPEKVRSAVSVAREVEIKIREAEVLLRPWVIRHAKPHKNQRRLTLSGRAILSDEPDVAMSDGLQITGKATLSFLLAARAQAFASLDQNSKKGAARSLYAYGLASSFEAYADTRANKQSSLDGGIQEQSQDGISPRLRWYLDRISRALPADSSDGWSAHPKIAAVVNRVRELWLAGEKVVVFCFYVETGKALRAHISRALMKVITDRARDRLGLRAASHDRVIDELGRISERLLRKDSTGYTLLRERVLALTHPLGDEVREQLAEIVIRFMRTPSFLVRFVDLNPRVSVDDLLVGFDKQDQSGRSLAEKVTDLAKAIELKVDYERDQLMAALEAIQTGTIAASIEDFDESELSLRREMLLPNVRLANGGVRIETRERLMLGFNTPFFPDILVASSVMAEGVDLHQDCRHVIHHDLDWNPSTLEQRTGRIDRIGSKSSKAGLPIHIYEPYLAGTHDEKMFKVVKDRERWFGVVMGESTPLDERSSECRANRVPLPEALAQRLSMDLSLAVS